MRLIEKSITSRVYEVLNESFDPDKTAKRVARYKEFDNGHVLHSWLEDKTADEVEELARLASIKNPDDVHYVQYDDVMNSSNDIRWLNGEKYVGGGFHYVDGKPVHHTDEEFDLVRKGEKTWEDIAKARMNESSETRECFGLRYTFEELVNSCKAQLLDGALDDIEHVKTLSDEELNNLARQYAEEEWNESEKINESEDAARDLGIEPGSDEEAQLNSLYDGKKIEWTELAGSDQTAVEHYFSNYGRDFSGKCWDDVESEIRSACHEIGYANEELIDDGYWSDGDMDPEPNEKMVMDYIFFNHFIPFINKKKDIKESAEEAIEEKKVTKVEVLVLPTIKFVWAEGNQSHVAALFGSAEEHDMDFSKFQNAVYVLDQEVAERNGGYDKVKYVANIQVKFTYEDGSTNEETSTYTGRVDCGDGYKYVTVSKNMKHTIQDVYKDAEVIVREDDTAELKESAGFDDMVLDSYNHLTNDLGKNPTVDDIVDDILNNYDQDYINDNTPEDSLQASKDVKYVLRHNNLEFEDLNESAAYEVDMTIEDNLEDEINNLLKSNNADGVQYKVVDKQGVGGGWPTVRFYGDDNKVRDFLGKIGYEDLDVYKKDNINESAEDTSMTLKEYAMKLHEGDIDMDVTDTEIDMVVAFVYNFNNTPEDNYDRFLNLLGERTKVVKANDWSLECDFSSVFKPYEDKLQDFFNMEYSEFDEAWAEAVLNLEGLIPGMSGEKTYGELIDILEGK